MADRFGAESTTEDVLAGVDLSGKRVLITGVSAGLGVETARAAAAPPLPVTLVSAPGETRGPRRARHAAS